MIAACGLGCNPAHVAHGRGARRGDALLRLRNAHGKLRVHLLALGLGGSRCFGARVARKRLRPSARLAQRPLMRGNRRIGLPLEPLRLLQIVVDVAAAVFQDGADGAAALPATSRHRAR